MLQLGIVRPSSSAWASPLHMVPNKATGDWRPCDDYESKHHSWPIPSTTRTRYLDFPKSCRHLFKTSQWQLQRFIGLVNFYRHFIPCCAELLQPLHALLNSKSKLQKLTWNEEAAAAFTATKEALANATILYYPKPDAPTCLLTDTSNMAGEGCFATVCRWHMAHDLLIF